MADDPTDGSDKDRNAPTVRELRGPNVPSVPSDTLPDVIGVYVPPRALPGPADHRTMDLKSVRLSDYVDARRALTERRLVSPPKPKQTRSALWLVPMLLVALGVGAWFLLRKPAFRGVGDAAPPEPAPVPVPTEVPHASPAPSAAPPPVVVGPSVTAEPPATAAPQTTVEEKPSAPAPTRTQRSREERKRKDPWLE
jgi:hypothetical protein